MITTYPNIYHTYLWLINLLRRNRSLSLAEINERWVSSELSDGTPIHRNTFRRYIEAIDEMLGVRIQASSKGKGCTYRIMYDHMMGERALSGWMLSTLNIANIMKQAKSIQNRILLENAPSGDHLLSEVTQAMLDGVLLHIKYQKFVDDEPYEAEVEPYCIKLFHQRWYLLAHRPGRDYLAVYAFDRMLWARPTITPFAFPQDFNAEAHFAHLFGVFQAPAGSMPDRVVIRTYNGEWNYMRTLPLHWSQTELEGKNSKNFVDFSFDLHPTRDFMLDLLSRGSNIEVLTPESLREELSAMIKSMASRYRKKRKPS